MTHQRPSALHTKSFDLALQVVSFAKVLRQSHNYEISSQVLRSGTSIMANILESKYAESRRDFLHKMNISLKESTELNGWLKLCIEHPELPAPIEEVRLLNDECRAMLVSTTRTLKKTLNS